MNGRVRGRVRAGIQWAKTCAEWVEEKEEMEKNEEEEGGGRI